MKHIRYQLEQDILDRIPAKPFFSYNSPPYSLIYNWMRLDAKYRVLFEAFRWNPKRWNMKTMCETLN